MKLGLLYTLGNESIHMTVLTKLNTTSFTAPKSEHKKEERGHLVKGAELVISDCHKPLFYLCLFERS